MVKFPLSYVTLKENLSMTLFYVNFCMTLFHNYHAFPAKKLKKVILIVSVYLLHNANISPHYRVKYKIYTKEI